MRKNTVEDFWLKVEKLDDDDCWNWTGIRYKTGYGYWEIAGVRWKTHRFSYFITYGSIPEGLLVCHHCDNPSCCNPKHLFLGTNKDNSQDMVFKGRACCMIGEKNPNFRKSWSERGQVNPTAKITKEIADQIREEYKQGTTQVKLAIKYDMHVVNISRIIRYKIWK